MSQKINRWNPRIVLNSSLFGVPVGIFLEDSPYLGPGGFPEFKTSARTFFRLQRLLRTKISSQLFFTAEPAPFESFSKGTFVVLLENIRHVVFFEKARVSFGKTQLDYIYPRVEWSFKRELSQWNILLVNHIFSCISPRVEYFSKIEDSFGKLHQIC